MRANQLVRVAEPATKTPTANMTKVAIWIRTSLAVRRMFNRISCAAQRGDSGGYSAESAVAVRARKRYTHYVVRSCEDRCTKSAYVVSTYCLSAMWWREC